MAGGDSGIAIPPQPGWVRAFVDVMSCSVSFSASGPADDLVGVVLR